jgi:hypothetical protein
VHGTCPKNLVFEFVDGDPTDPSSDAFDHALS